VILALFTSTPQFGAAALGEDGTLLSEFTTGPGRRNFRGFMPAVDSVIRASGEEPSDLRGIAVAVGPGSFTGLRVGLAAAKGIAHGLGIPVVGIPSLEAVAYMAPESSLPICAILDSRKGELFLGLFERDPSGGLIRLKEDACVHEGELDREIQGPCLFIGNDYGRQAPIVRSLHAGMAKLAPPLFWHPSAAAVGALGLPRIVKNEPDDLRDLVPVYFRPPDIRPGPPRANRSRHSPGVCEG